MGELLNFVPDDVGTSDFLFALDRWLICFYQRFKPFFHLISVVEKT